MRATSIFKTTTESCYKVVVLSNERNVNERGSGGFDGCRKLRVLSAFELSAEQIERNSAR
jgi:hypothetical protein